MVGKFCDLLHDNGMGFVGYNRAYFFPTGVEREGGGSCCSTIKNSKFSNVHFVHIILSIVSF